jgi:L-fuconolactonase
LGLTTGARRANADAKISGLDAGQSDRWTAADIAPYVDHALELFGPDRIMFGSDWPVAILRGGYAKVWHETNLALAAQRILGGTAVDVYRLRITNTP